MAYPVHEPSQQKVSFHPHKKAKQGELEPFTPEKDSKAPALLLSPKREKERLLFHALFVLGACLFSCFFHSPATCVCRFLPRLAFKCYWMILWKLIWSTPTFLGLREANGYVDTGERGGGRAKRTSAAAAPMGTLTNNFT